MSLHAGDELPGWIERDFDRRALVPRLGVLVLLLLAALADYGHGHRVGHWIVLGAYGVATFIAAIGTRSRSEAVAAWLPATSTVVDGTIAVYIIADHLPMDAGEARVATDAVSLLPAFLFLLQTGLRLRPRLIALFAAVVGAGWAISLAFVLPVSGLPPDVRTSVLVREGISLVAFLAAAAFVLYFSLWLRGSAALTMRVLEDRVTLSRFLPAGVVTEVARTGGTATVVERHATLLDVDLRGSSALAREHPPATVVEWLLEFRRLVHDAITANGGVVDKYVGDGVIALFLDGDEREQAERALTAVETILAALRSLNEERRRKGAPHLRVIAVVHCGRVLAGVFDDGRRAEFTVLGPVMNDLSRIERRAKEANRDVVASAEVLKRLAPAKIEHLSAQVLAPPTHARGLPELFSVLADCPKEPDPLAARKLRDNAGRCP